MNKPDQPNWVVWEQFNAGGTLWTLHRDGRTIVAEVHEIEGIGLELRYMRDREPGFVWIRFRNAMELLKEAALETVRARGPRLDGPSTLAVFRAPTCAAGESRCSLRRPKAGVTA